MSYNKEMGKLRKRLQNKVLVMGIGNRLRGDDGVGPEIVSRLKNRVHNLLLFDVGEVPENYLEKIASEKSNTIVLIDAVELGASPGKIKIVESEDIKDESLSTHKVSLKLVATYLRKRTSADVFLLGIQPQNTKFGGEISDSVREALEKVVRALEIS